MSHSFTRCLQNVLPTSEHESLDHKLYRRRHNMTQCLAVKTSLNPNFQRAFQPDKRLFTLNSSIT